MRASRVPRVALRSGKKHRLHACNNLSGMVGGGGTDRGVNGTVINSSIIFKRFAEDCKFGTWAALAGFEKSLQGCALHILMFRLVKFQELLKGLDWALSTLS